MSDDVSDAYPALRRHLASEHEVPFDLGKSPDYQALREQHIHLHDRWRVEVDHPLSDLSWDPDKTVDLVNRGVMKFLTEPTDQHPVGSECPVHHRVHSSHGWYVCVVPRIEPTQEQFLEIGKAVLELAPLADLTYRQNQTLISLAVEGKSAEEIVAAIRGVTT